MKEIDYKCRPLTGNQRHQMENVLIEEMDVQAMVRHHIQRHS